MSLAAWDSYAEHLAVLGQWNPGSGVIARDAARLVRDDAASGAVTVQAILLLRQSWTSLPDSVREPALAALSEAARALSDAADGLAAGFEGIPIAELIATVVKALVGIGESFAGVAAVKKHASAYAKGEAQRKTLGILASSGRGVFDVAPMYEYAKYIKVRGGGDFDRLTAFARAPGGRDKIFMASPTSAGSGCSRPMRRGFDDSYGPFAPSCGRAIGVSALFFPWWSTAYSPGPLLRWQGSPPGAEFQAGLSPDTTGFIAGLQAGMLTDPAVNARCRLAHVLQTSSRFSSWWQGHTELQRLKTEIDGSLENLVLAGNPDRKAIDKSRDANHVPTASARAFWYYDADGLIQPYPDQAGSDLTRWGVPLPDAAKGPSLACSAAMHNGIKSMVAAFAQRRLATIRSPLLAQALVTDIGILAIDPGARAAISFARGRPGILAYPGGVQRVKFAKIAPPLRKAVASAGTGKAGGAPLAVAAAAAFFLLR